MATAAVAAVRRQAGFLQGRVLAAGRWAGRVLVGSRSGGRELHKLLLLILPLFQFPLQFTLPLTPLPPSPLFVLSLYSTSIYPSFFVPLLNEHRAVLRHVRPAS